MSTQRRITVMAAPGRSSAATSSFSQLVTVAGREQTGVHVLPVTRTTVASPAGSVLTSESATAAETRTAIW